jgi:hypothetical protein
MDIDSACNISLATVLVREIGKCIVDGAALARRCEITAGLVAVGIQLNTVLVETNTGMFRLIRLTRDVDRSKRRAYIGCR